MVEAITGCSGLHGWGVDEKGLQHLVQGALVPGAKNSSTASSPAPTLALWLVAYTLHHWPLAQAEVDIAVVQCHHPPV